MQVDQWGEILETGGEKEKPLSPSHLGRIEEIGVDQLSALGQKIKRYGNAKARNREMAAFLVSQSTNASNDPNKRMAQKLYDCASWLEFNHYLDTGHNRLVRASLCKKPLLCPVCAIRRGVKTLRNYHERAMHLADKYDFYAMALTVKNGPDLWERYQHLKHSFKRLRDKAKKGYGVWAQVSGAVWSTEFTHSEATGWHPHLHLLIALPKGASPIRYGQGSQLALDWEIVTGDSFITHVGSNLANEGDLAAGLCEVLKYALKFSDLSLADNLHAYETLKGKRLIQSSGCFYGLELPDDDPLTDAVEDGPYVQLFMRYTSSGYRFAAPV